MPKFDTIPVGPVRLMPATVTALDKLSKSGPPEYKGRNRSQLIRLAIEKLIQEASK